MGGDNLSFVRPLLVIDLLVSNFNFRQNPEEAPNLKSVWRALGAFIY